MFNSNNKNERKHIYEWVELEISIKCKQCNVTYSVQNLKEEQECPLCLTKADIGINSLSCDLISHNEDIEVKYYKEDEGNYFAKSKASFKKKRKTNTICSTCNKKINSEDILTAIENNTDYVCPKCNTSYKIKDADSENKEIADNFNNGGIKIEAVIYKEYRSKEDEKEYIKHSCVSCGADLKAHRTDSEIRCEYCGTLNTIKRQKVFAKELNNQKIIFLIDKYQYEYNIEEERKRKEEEDRRRLKEMKKIVQIMDAISYISTHLSIISLFLGGLFWIIVILFSILTNLSLSDKSWFINTGAISFIGAIIFKILTVFSVFTREKEKLSKKEYLIIALIITFTMSLLRINTDILGYRTKIKGINYTLVESHYKNNLWGVINNNNELYIPIEFKYNNIEHLYKDYFKIKTEKNKYGIINNKGIIIPTKYTRIEYLRNDDKTILGSGFFLLYNQEYYYEGLYNKKGIQILSKEYTVYDISNNCFFIQDRKNKYGVSDTLGNIVLPTKYDNIEHLDSNYYEITLINNKKEYYGIINNNGKLIIPIIYSKIKYLKYKKNDIINNRYIIFFETFKNNKYEGLYNNNGKQIISDKYLVYNMKYNYLKIKNRISKRYGLADTLGNIVLPTKYYDIISIDYDKAEVKDNRKDKAYFVNLRK